MHSNSYQVIYPQKSYSLNAVHLCRPMCNKITGPRKGVTMAASKKKNECNTNRIKHYFNYYSLYFSGSHSQRVRKDTRSICHKNPLWQ